MSDLRLFNFLNDPLLNDLRFQMNATLAKAWQTGRRIPLLDPEAIRILGKSGIDVKIDEISVEKDKTLSYKGNRVVIYIRDITTYRGELALPSYHLAYCRTLDTMRANNRWGRYVAANRDDGLFNVNFMEAKTRAALEKLNVCQNCLELISWEDFSIARTGKARKAEILHQFTLSAFFEVFPKDLMSIIPTYTSDVAPINDYSDDWGLISEKLKRTRGYKCQRCPVVLAGDDRKFLHVHHENGEKSDNREHNLVVLCIRCHSAEPMHSHMLSSRKLAEFSAKFPA